MTPFFSINFDWCAQQNLLTAWIHWQTTAAVCPTWFFLLLFKLWWLILLASSQNTLRSWNNYTLFSRTYYCVNLYHIGVHAHLIYSDNFAGRVKCSLGSIPLVCFSINFFLFTEAILFDFQWNSPSIFTLWHATLH